MDVRTRQHDVAGFSVLSVEGATDLAAAPRLHDALQRFVRDVAPGTDLAVDLDGVSILDDTALGLLLGAAAHARSHGCTFRVVCADDRLRVRLATTRLDRAVDVVTSLSATVADETPGVS